MKDNSVPLPLGRRLSVRCTRLLSLIAVRSFGFTALVRPLRSDESIRLFGSTARFRFAMPGVFTLFATDGVTGLSGRKLGLCSGALVGRRTTACPGLGALGVTVCASGAAARPFALWEG